MFNSSLESILSSFTTLTAKLEKFIDLMEHEQSQLTTNIAELESKRIGIINDKTRAKKVKANITKILGE